MAEVKNLIALGMPSSLAVRVARVPETVSTEANLTDNSSGTASDTIAAIGATYNQNEVRNAIASLTAKVNALLTASKGSGIVS